MYTKDVEYLMVNGKYRLRCIEVWVTQTATTQGYVSTINNLIRASSTVQATLLHTLFLTPYGMHRA